MSVVIVGGGIAGLATAYELQRRGVPFVLLESAPRLGGVILSEQIDGFTIDGGPDALLLQKPEGVRLCEELGIGDRLVSTLPPRLAYIQRAGVLHPLPASSVLGIPTRIGPFAATRLFSWAAKARMGAELFIPARKDDADESIGAFMTRRFGREACEYLAEPLLAGIHAGDVDRLSVRALFPRFVEAERAHGSLLRAFRADAKQRAARESGAASSREGAFVSLPGGLSELVAALDRALRADTIRRNTAAVRVVRKDGRLRVETAAGAAIDADAVVLAAPAHVTTRLLQDFDPELSSLCGGIHYASTATIALAFERSAIRHPLNGSGFVVPRTERTGILAASWLSSKWPHRAPEGRVLMRTFAGGARDPEAIDQTDDELVARSLKALGPLLGISGQPMLTRVYRWKRASAQHDVGHIERMQAIDAALDRHPGLFVTGSGFRGVGIPDCIADGRATATRLASRIQQAPPLARSS